MTRFTKFGCLNAIPSCVIYECNIDAGMLIEKIEDYVSILFLPLYFAYSGLQTQLSSINSGTAGMKALFKPIGCIDLEPLHNLQTVCCSMSSFCNLNIHNSKL